MFDDGYRVIYTDNLSPKHKLTISGRRLPQTDQIELKITYHYPPAIGLHMVEKLTLVNPDSQFKFASLTDANTGVKCIYDQNDVGLIFLFSSTTEDLFHTGRDGGWYGTTTTEWSTIFDDIKSRKPNIPFDQLPSLKNAG